MSEEPVQLHEPQFQVLRRVLRNPVRIPESRADLYILNRRHLVNDAVPRLAIVGDIPVRIQVFIRQLQVVPLGNPPIGLDKCGELAAGTDRSLWRLQLLGSLNWTPTWYRRRGKSPAAIARSIVANLR